ncbi:MAG: PKD domain-containing protein [Candidatus Azobacteroides sp.]|nr:PKD domain-containing protein [Candidatus Azobacteroides sp.]
MNKLSLALALLLPVCSCHEEQTIPVEIDVVLHIRDDNHTSPLLVTIENRTESASSFLWTFEGGEPATSAKENPGVVTFTAPGEHRITLEAWNDGDRASKTYTIRVDSAVTAAFRADVDINNYAPATYRITNLSSGGSSYRWTFEGGEPSSCEGQFPPAVTYAREGMYTICLTIDNGSATFTATQEIEVRESMAASFSIVPSFEDIDDMEAPLRATFDTRLQGVETLSWECAGAVITDNTSVNASAYFPSAGQYTVCLNVSNGKETKQVSQNITVKENTNLRTHKDIRLGINTARETIGSVYSTKLRRVFRTSEITGSNGSFIDLVFFGLNRSFSYNLFVSPDNAGTTALPDIPNALPTKFINKTELGTISLTSAQFEAMTTDALLRNMPILSADYGDEFFTDTPLPRVVLFETADGRKGAILVKEMVAGGTEDSYITADIKVQKND